MVKFKLIFSLYAFMFPLSEANPWLLRIKYMNFLHKISLDTVHVCSVCVDVVAYAVY